MEMRRGASNGPDPNANDTIVLLAGSPFSEGPNAAGRAKNPLPMNWTALYKNPSGAGFESSKRIWVW
jgi:hypothetical protein